MHYYKFNIGDYASHTRHLSLMEDLAYRRLLDIAYSSEVPLTKDIHSLARLIGMRDYQSEITDVLNEFFDEVEEGWIHGRVLKEIEEAAGRSDKAKIAAKSRWERKRNAEAMRMQCSEDASSINKNASSTESDATQDPLPITQDTDKTLVDSKAVRLNCPHQQIIEIYHQELPQLPVVRVWNEKRKRLLSARWREDPTRQSLEFWRKYFRYVSKSDFLTGRANGFQASLEWLVNSSNFVKVIEGNYENRETT